MASDEKDVQMINMDAAEDDDSSGKDSLKDSQADGELIAKKSVDKPRRSIPQMIARTLRKNKFFILFMSAFALFYLLGGMRSFVLETQFSFLIFFMMSSKQLR